MWHGMACSVHMHIHHCDCDCSAGGYGRKAKRTELVTGKLLDPEDLCCSTTGKIVNVPKYAMRSIEGAVGVSLFFFSHQNASGCACPDIWAVEMVLEHRLR